jgi:carboxyl-terminal processing protease
MFSQYPMEKPMRASARTLTIALFGAAVAWSPTATPQERSGQTAAVTDESLPDRPSVVDDKPVPEVQGVWRSRGYGYIVKVDAKGAKLFHVAGDFCYADPRPDDEVDDVITLYRPFGPNAMAFSTDRSGTRVVFDRLPGLPAACTDRARWSVPRVAALVAATFADLYPSFERRGIDWPERTKAALATLDEKSSDDALFRTLQIMLAGIDDPHVELHAKVKRKELQLMPGEGPTLSRMRKAFGPEATEAAVPAYREGITSIVLRGNAQVKAEQRLYWGRVGDIGYLNILSMEGLSTRGEEGDKEVIDAAMDEAMAAFDGARAVIVDVTYNLGGFDGVSRRIAGRFAANRTFAYTKVAKGARDVPPQPFHVAPSPRHRYLGPVVLVTSNITVSAGEIFTLLMRSLPNVRQVGKTTRGALSDMTEKPLPNGWSLSLPAEIYVDAGGLWYEVRGIPPQLQGDVFPADNMTSGHAQRVNYLIEKVEQWFPKVDTTAGAP